MTAENPTKAELLAQLQEAQGQKLFAIEVASHASAHSAAAEAQAVRLTKLLRRISNTTTDAAVVRRISQHLASHK